jgi:two-component system sensor histidine kinase DesK
MIATQTQRGKTRIAWLAGGFIATVAPALTGHVSWYYSAGSLMFGPLSIAATAINSKLQDQTETLLRNRTEMRDLAITAERERIARDMHDTLGHLLSVMTAKADLALKLTDRDLGQARQEIQDIHLTGRQALKDVRNVIAGMENTTIANELGHARYLLETANIHIKISNQSPTLPPEHQHALGMIIREATTNVVKHSNASRCEIYLTQERDNLLLQVKDNGVGVSFEPRAGLSSMRKRAEQLNGTLHISAQKPNETLLELRLPMDMRH